MNKNESAAVAGSGRLKCPRCGGEMNRHAEKIDYAGDPSAFDAALGGAVEEFHTCPNCRYVLERRVSG
jgi:uncharacterized C2H2 Zn-finger protein